MGLRIVMLGAPGVGKGTQAVRIAQRLAAPHISTGDIFRAHLREGTDLGKHVQRYLVAGQLVPDELTCTIVADRLQAEDCRSGYVLDGFPRSVPQAEALTKMLDERGDRLDMAINIEVPDEEIVERLAARRFCPKCGKIFNLKSSPSANGGRCDAPGCDGKLEQRSDDEEQTIRERLRVYHETTEPIIGYYASQEILRTVPASEAGPDAVFAKVEQLIETAGAA
ncbi:MAG TPA: adenylate kinase [Candidatus Hydrogenedentes bacterium]|nr:adenylate kinase [Candidatus Hydrogenedentota bacterium]HQH51631.1 adenylate kinase [Candidatus Hydrogenedentota bacterium]HQM49958.1 adenylate kinase [Candidatus Hydrogenedentota bacterium]